MNSTWATNGYFTHGMGTKNKAMGGAGIALPDEAMAVVNNPAVATKVSNRSELGVGLFMPRSNYISSDSNLNGQDGAFTIGPNDIDAENQTIFAPFFASSWELAENSAFAAALYTRPGMSSEYLGGTATFDPDGDGPLGVVTQPGTFGDGDVKWKLNQMMLDLTYAYQLNERLGLGVSAVLASQSFRVTGIGTLAPLTQTYAASAGTTMPNELSGNGNESSYGGGLKLGVHFQWTPTLSLGLMYQSKILMSDFSDYSDLFPSGGNFDIPADIKFGVSWRFLQPAVFSIDIEHIFYGDVKALGNSLQDLMTCPTAGQGGSDVSACLGGSQGGGLGWDDMTVYKFGLAVELGAHWVARAGFSVGNQPIPVSNATNNLMTPYYSEAHYTLGFTYAFNNGRELNFSAMYTEEESLHEANAFDPTQVIVSEADQFDFELSYSWRF